MKYIVENIIDAVAGVLAHFDYPVYSSPMQQEVETPCFFISLMPSTSDKLIDNRFSNDLALDIVFIQQPNITNAMDGVFPVIEYLDHNLDTFSYTDGTNTGVIHTYDRSYHMEDKDLHYQVHVKTRTLIETDPTKILIIEEINDEIKRK